ncbi:nudix family protein [Halogeometricum borinquense DSM 11551]|uniref:Nudix family protein n=2 Tax=Halogeometricum borinquense TaxID=60847 RepID=E4NRW3_HALBP|nr:CoA pyrophosphatase [Halogeometricum borinquense]ADQ68009.1 NUDIX family protein [Halogeometricum borinquense DSM 11551]ELY24070.1 nudix family protein [Halogeometricum borinquense DSM 11551]RYJ13071.1 CoA pyrophosphatase [Halogeometricum borinquense]
MDLSRVSSCDAETLTDAGRQAAVIAPVLTRRGEDHVLFTKRADHLGEHPGQMSFPGGSREPSDGDLRATALREAYEEIGLRSNEVEFFGCLDDIKTVTDYSVTPFVARVPDREYEPDEREVAEIAVLAVSDLTNLDNYESEERMHPHYGKRRLHFFHVDGYTVWGATGRMLVQLLELTTDWRAPPEPDRVVDPDAELPL